MNVCKAMLAHCGEIHEDDGVDPREYFKPDRSEKKEDHKAKQLCRQVAETIDQVLAGETNDELLRASRGGRGAGTDASRVLVTLHADCQPAEFDREAIEAALAQRQGQLRCAVAAAITRRKAPSLLFSVLGPVAGRSIPGRTNNEE